MDSAMNLGDFLTLPTEELEPVSPFTPEPRLEPTVGKERKQCIYRRKWTKEEDAQLLRAVKEHGTQNWAVVADFVPTRSKTQCLQRYKKVLCPVLVRGPWAKNEDQLLISLITQQRIRQLDQSAPIDWRSIAEQIPGRSPKQCRERWALNLDPWLKHGEWSAEEDNILLQKYAELGSRWSIIVKCIPRRTENSVKTRFYSIMRTTIKKRGWTEVDDFVFLCGLLKYGKHFQIISRLMLGRSKTQLKNRYDSVFACDPELVRSIEKIDDGTGDVAVLLEASPVHEIEKELRRYLGVCWEFWKDTSFDQIKQCFKLDKSPEVNRILSATTAIEATLEGTHSQRVALTAIPKFELSFEEEDHPDGCLDRFPFLDECFPQDLPNGF